MPNGHIASKKRPGDRLGNVNKFITKIILPF